MQFKKFPVESIRKQLIRKSTIGLDHLAVSAMYNAILAGTVITAMNFAKGRDSQTDLEGALRAGAMYNADFGSIGMIWDIGMSLTGAPDAWSINPYAKYSDGLNIAAIGLGNDWYNMLAAGIDLSDGNIEDNDTRRSMRALPIVGNQVAIMGLMNALDGE